MITGYATYDGGSYGSNKESGCCSSCCTYSQCCWLSESSAVPDGPDGPDYDYGYGCCTYSTCCGCGGTATTATKKTSLNYTSSSSGTFIIGARENERYLHMGHFPITAIKTIKPSQVLTNGEETYNSNVDNYDVSIVGLVHGINLEENAISVSFIENGEFKTYNLATVEIVEPISTSINGAKNYGRRTGNSDSSVFAFSNPFSYEMLTTIKLTVRTSGLGLGATDREITESDGAVLTATNNAEVYKLIAYGNEVCSFK